MYQSWNKTPPFRSIQVDEELQTERNDGLFLEKWDDPKSEQTTRDLLFWDRLVLKQKFTIFSFDRNLIYTTFKQLRSLNVFIICYVPVRSEPTYPTSTVIIREIVP